MIEPSESLDRLVLALAGAGLSPNEVEAQLLQLRAALIIAVLAERPDSVPACLDQAADEAVALVRARLARLDSASGWSQP